MKNIETVKAFNTFLDDTILKSTQKVIEKHTANTMPVTEALTESANIYTEWEENVPQGEGQEETWVQAESSLIPVLDTLEPEEDWEIKLVDKWEKKVQQRNNYILFRSQIRNLIIAILATLIVFFLFPLNLAKNNKFIWFFFILVFIFQFLVFTPLAAKNGEARWWVNLWPLPNMQPIEFFKLWYVFFMSYWITKRKEFINSTKFLVQFWAINAFILTIILCIPDFWSLFILSVTWALMAWYSWLSVKKLAILWVSAVVLAWMLLGLMSLVWYNGYALDRLSTFVTRDDESRSNIKLREGWQIEQWLIAIWAWGFWWQWYGKWLQKMWNLPEAYSDMIFAAYSEEVWLLGNLILFFLYAGLFFVVLRNIVYQKDFQLRLLWVGILSLIIVQVFVHIWVNLDILPNTWLTLPFVSHGGTALMINLVELAFLCKILENKKEKQILADNTSN